MYCEDRCFELLSLVDGRTGTIIQRVDSPASTRSSRKRASSVPPMPRSRTPVTAGRLPPPPLTLLPVELYAGASSPVTSDGLHEIQLFHSEGS